MKDIMQLLAMLFLIGAGLWLIGSIFTYLDYNPKVSLLVIAVIAVGVWLRKSFLEEEYDKKQAELDAETKYFYQQAIDGKITNDEAYQKTQAVRERLFGKPKPMNDYSDQI